MDIVSGLLLLVGLLLGVLLVADYAYRMGGTMEERRAVVFEVYRYAICFVTVLLFGQMAFQLIGAVVVDVNNVQAMAGPGIGALLSGLLFLIHWFIKNPASPKPSA